MHLVLVDGEWRISDPPPELLLTNSEFSDGVPAARAVFPGPDRDRRGAGRSARGDRADAGQPGQPAALDADPRAEQCLGRRGRHPVHRPKSRAAVEPSVDSEGVLQVDLTGVDVSTPEARRALAAQLVWTLSPTSPRIAITVDGEALDPSQPVYTINSVSSFDPDRLAGTGQVASDPFYVNPAGAIVGLLDEQPMPGPLGSGAAVVTSAAQVLGHRRDRRGGGRPGGDQALLMVRPQETDRADPVLQAEHHHAAELHPWRRRGLGRPERRDKAGGVPDLGHRESEPGAGRLRRVRREGTGHGARALAGRRAGRRRCRASGCIWGC